MQASGQSGYVGIYYWNFGSPELMLLAQAAGELDAAGQHV